MGQSSLTVIHLQNKLSIELGSVPNWLDAQQRWLLHVSALSLWSTKVNIYSQIPVRRIPVLTTVYMSLVQLRHLFKFRHLFAGVCEYWTLGGSYLCINEASLLWLSCPNKFETRLLLRQMLVFLHDFNDESDLIFIVSVFLSFPGCDNIMSIDSYFSGRNKP